MPSSTEVSLAKSHFSVSFCTFAFLIEGDILCQNEILLQIKSMPNVYRYSIDNLNEVRDIAESQNINLIALFPYTPKELKVIVLCKTNRQTRTIIRSITRTNLKKGRSKKADDQIIRQKYGQT